MLIKKPVISVVTNHLVIKVGWVFDLIRIYAMQSIFITLNPDTK